ncbi:MAG: O-antigen ligase family protein [Clostridiales bacterium]|nr:O-antigen ligase family protein [Clostridiales bacterium]
MNLIAQNDTKAMDRLWRFLLICMTLAALMPEYIAPVLVFVVAVMYFHKLKVEKRKPVISTVGRLCLAFVIWQFIGVIWTGNRTIGLLVAFLWALSFCAYLVTSETVNSFQRMEKIIFFISITGGIAGLIGIIEVFLMHFGGYISKSLTSMFNPFWRGLNYLVAKLATTVILPDFFVNQLPNTQFVNISLRASSTFTNPLIFAYFLIMVLPFSVYGMFHSTLKKKRLLSFICLILIIGGIASSYSRGPYLATMLAVIILMFYSRKTAYKLLGLSFGSLIMLAMVAPGVFQRFLTIGSTTDTSINLRYNIWHATIETIKEHPFLGLGTGVENMREILANQYHIYQPHAHNLFLEIFVEGGIFGFTLFAALLLYCAYRIFQLCILSNRGRALGLSFLSGFVGIMACGMLDHVLYGPKIVMYFMFFMGLAEAAFRICKAEVKTKEIAGAIDI